LTCVDIAVRLLTTIFGDNKILGNAPGAEQEEYGGEAMMLISIVTFVVFREREE
jgi:hypothetical protein